ncbi:hypothetical protein BANRA_00010 [Escherichia coli]|nr:hypothetical protein BANRA_00010 [Escherichia coli]
MHYLRLYRVVRWDYQRKNLLGVPRKRHRTGEQTATSILKQRTKSCTVAFAHQQQKSPQEKTVVSITVDPESPESFMKLPKRRRWVKEKYTLG